MEHYYDWFWSKLIDDLDQIYATFDDSWNFVYKRKLCSDCNHDEFATPNHHVPLPYHGIGDFIGFNFKWVGLKGVILMEPMTWAFGCPIDSEELTVFAAPITEEYHCEWPMKQQFTYVENVVHEWLNRNWNVEDDTDRDDFPPLRPIDIRWLDILDSREAISEHLTNQWLKALSWQYVADIEHFYIWVCNEVEDVSYYNSLLLYYCVADFFETLYEKFVNLKNAHSLHAHENIFYASVHPNLNRSDMYLQLQTHLGEKLEAVDRHRSEFILHNIYCNITKTEQILTEYCSQRSYLEWAAIVADTLSHSTMYYTIETKKVPWERNISFIIIEYLFTDLVPDNKRDILKTKSFYDGYQSTIEFYDFDLIEEPTEIIRAGLEKTEALWT